MSNSFTDISQFTKLSLEKNIKRLFGRTASGVEDALKKLDKLTDEEARMASEQNLKATHNVDESLGGVANMVVAVDDRVADVDDRAAGVDSRIAYVDEVAGVDGTVNKVHDKDTEVIHGVLKSFVQSPMQYLNPELPRWKKRKGG